MKNSLFWAVSIFFSSQLFAAADAISVRVDVPTADPLDVVEKYQSRPLESIDLGISTWSPALDLKTRQNGLLSLNPNWPMLSLAYLSAPANLWSSLDTYFVGGVSYLQLAPENQKTHRVHLLIGNLGVQLSPAVLNFRYVSAYGRFAALPTGYLAASSVIAPESNHFDMPLQMSAGVFFKSPWTTPAGGFGHFVPTGLAVSYDQTFSLIGDEEMSGYGMSLGLRFPI